jgi:hypothetical protein
MSCSPQSVFYRVDAITFAGLSVAGGVPLDERALRIAPFTGRRYNRTSNWPSRFTPRGLCSVCQNIKKPRSKG